jgi:hypothetical protein
MKRTIVPILALLLALPLAGCGASQPLSNVSLSQALLEPHGDTSRVGISYRIGAPAKVWIYLQDEKGGRYVLRDGEARTPSSEPYTLSFDGAVPTGDPVLVRRVLPSGAYQVIVRAQTADGREQQASAGTLRIQGADTPPPLIEDLAVYPEVISPNADGIDDVAEITYRLPVTATVDITLTAPDGTTVYPFVTNDKEEPILQKHVWNGKTTDGVLLPDGAYSYTITARDAYGNVVQRRGTITISGSGQPEATITYSYMAPQSLMLGEVLTVTLRVKNTGDVPIRTYGPPSGFEYSTKDVFSSVAGGQYDAKSGGFWRVGVDWDANSGGGPKRYPFRWAISPRPPEQWKVPGVEDELRPGEEATIIGRIRVEQQETKMGFYVGLIQDGVGFFQDKTGRTIVKVGF